MYQKQNEISSGVAKMEAENRKLKGLLDQYRQQLKDERKQKPMACEYCRHFIRHYVRDGYSYNETYMGHCVHGRKGRMRGGDEGCKFFELKGEEL